MICINDIQVSTNAHEISLPLLLLRMRAISNWIIIFSPLSLTASLAWCFTSTMLFNVNPIPLFRVLCHLLSCVSREGSNSVLVVISCAVGASFIDCCDGVLKSYWVWKESITTSILLWCSSSRVYILIPSVVSGAEIKGWGSLSLPPITGRGIGGGAESPAHLEEAWSGWANWSTIESQWHLAKMYHADEGLWVPRPCNWDGVVR